MPVIHITLVKGRDDEKIKECVREVARTAARTLEAPLDSVRVMVHETEPDRFAVGDRLKSDM
ncbi:tautomerase family protein [Streptomyces sp. NPDC044780]|uniref:tautomerase family protein n=1 Tax=unclassified Streptomyces TaxID=2593676 RepID=UPI0033CC4689